MPTKILVVDDEPDLELLISHHYKKRVRDNELQFSFAQNGVQALQKLQAGGEVDVVLTDINMPEMDGLTLLVKLNEHYPLLRTVIISAYGDMANIRKALNHGAFDFVTKPIDFDDLDATLDKTIQESKARKQAVKDHDQLVALQRELDLARHIQKSMVPKIFPPFPERKEFEIHAEMIPAREVGGDFYDFFLIDDARLGVVIGDVSGKSVPAALFMAVSKTVLKSTALKGLPPEECLQQVNRILCLESVEEMFVTVFYGILNFRTGEVTYCNGGHNPPYLLRNDGHVEITNKTDGLLLGIHENWSYRAKRITLQPGDGLILYTDGVTEALSHENNQYTEARLATYLKHCNGSAPPDIIRGLVEEVRQFSGDAQQADDITILALKYWG
ncbi:MAG: SpoIIE family protein phosphatase [candidate division KSB1 bacterium]|nr:SpoIIE family protein phosphatase [candidate division KSB1 bacterium]MDZ7304330.1 SpoIIE family protein phosphatase [candidate division KSB1 bacterium]MDZ7313606.1 SpoIIE family protein phosphatase [candidate division KSB1 bacterium]